jgi:hypothetical protein
LNAGKLRRATDWDSVTSLDDGIAITAKWLQNADI